MNGVLCLLLVLPDQVYEFFGGASLGVLSLLDGVDMADVVFPGAWRWAPLLLLFRALGTRGWGSCFRVDTGRSAFSLLALGRLGSAAKLLEVFIQNVDGAAPRIVSHDHDMPCRTVRAYMLLSGSHVRSIGSS